MYNFWASIQHHSLFHVLKEINVGVEITKAYATDM